MTTQERYARYVASEEQVNRAEWLAWLARAEVRAGIAEVSA